ncbi:cyclic di-AMP binding protein CbpA [Loigolactobacillus coryniformis]|uniref:CBS domain-containing protein n=1 Tax=Loigolactobacillus coryniformis TaxID=1610 RepID=A0A5B8TE87_9LACO|nr:cyclic di-AMP binding protein CbpA [Loigolactobacillus coryniformis]QEA52132.1 CBS domain-containing protein [Loigolactobacillus coryniformis]RRG00671.1 MAG: CBS domain-containing protein [Lactobacillus sp.]
MLLKSMVQTKEQITSIKETATLAEALTILEDTGYRCVPILNESGQIFRGNIYKMHIYRHKSRGGAMDLPVTHLLKNATKYIPVDAPFFKVFFTIKDLPYVAVLDQQNYFYGILTHNHLMTMLSQSWNVNVGSYVLTVVSTGERGDLTDMSRIISRYVSIANCITLDSEPGELIRRTLFTLPSGTSEETLHKIIDHLQRKEFTVPEVEDLRVE